MKILSKVQVLKLHEMLIAASGESPEIREEGLLDSACNAPFQSFWGTELIPVSSKKLLVLGFGLIKNHPFVDGNKRIGVHSMLVFLTVNHIKLCYENSNLTDLILKIASGSHDEKYLLVWTNSI